MGNSKIDDFESRTQKNVRKKSAYFNHVRKKWGGRQNIPISSFGRFSQFFQQLESSSLLDMGEFP